MTWTVLWWHRSEILNNIDTNTRAGVPTLWDSGSIRPVARSDCESCGTVVPQQVVAFSGALGTETRRDGLCGVTTILNGYQQRTFQADPPEETGLAGLIK